MKFKAFATLLLLVSAPLLAKVTYQIPRVDKAPTIDADLTDKIWQKATKVKLGYNVFPGDSTPAEVETTAWIMEDGEQLYIAFKADDPDPSQIRAFIRDQDRIFQDDFVGVILDTFNQERRAFEFFVNPMGSQGDLTRDDTRGGREDSNWNTVWDSAGKVTKEGYQVEMAIPFKALRYTADLDMQTWSIQFIRIHPRDSRTVYTDNKGNRELDCAICQFNKITGMPNLKSQTTNLDFTPTMTYVKSQSRDVDPKTSWDTTQDEIDVGLDMRWAMTEDWILNATINPDFSQVEVDGAQLDVNTTFSLFFPEKRPFFLEGADYFSSYNRLVHTRNIADPDFGTKVTGKTGDYTIGVMAASDEVTSFLIPSSQGSYVQNLEDQASDVFIARAQKNIGDKSNIGMLVTSRDGGDYSNTVTAIDGTYYFTDNDVLRYQVMHSQSDNPDEIRFDGTNELFAADQSDQAVSLSYRHNQENYHLRASYSDFGEDFRADLGFVGKVDYKQLVLGGGYTWFGEEGSDWTRFRLSGDWDKTEDQSGLMLEEESELYFSVNGPMQFFSNIGYLVRDRYYNGQTFQESWWSNYSEITLMPGLRVGNFMRFGDNIDFANSQLAEVSSYSPYINWQIGKHFNVSLNYSDYTLDVLEGELLNAKVYDLRMAYQFDNRTRLSLTVQQRDINRNSAFYKANQDNDPDNDYTDEFSNMGTQLIYSYKINPLTLFYVGYSDAAINTENLSSLQKTDKTIFTKFSYLYQL
jgi:hypothetical protein